MSDLTTIEKLVDPEVMTQMINGQLPKAVRFTAIAPIDTTLTGRPGTTVTVPKYKHIKNAVDVAEGAKVDYQALETATEKFTIKKMATGVKLTDEAVLSGYGDPIGEANKQIANAMASKLDDDILATASKARLQLPTADFSKIDFIDDIEAGFIDDPSANNVEGDDTARGIIFVNPKDANKIRKAAALNWERQSDLGDSMLASGVFGGLLGWQIVRSRKIPEGSAVVAKPGAMKTYTKRAINAETGRDMDTKSTKFNADMHYGVAIYDDTKLMVIKPFAVETGTVIEGNVPKQETAKAPK